MSKLIVVNEDSGTRFPFLRGMLVKSLQQAGLDFSDAYNVASDVRDDFEDNDEISTVELRERIEEILGEDYPGTVLTRYKKEDISRKISASSVRMEPGSLSPEARMSKDCKAAQSPAQPVMR